MTFSGKLALLVVSRAGLQPATHWLKAAEPVPSSHGSYNSLTFYTGLQPLRSTPVTPAHTWFPVYTSQICHKNSVRHVCIRKGTQLRGTVTFVWAVCFRIQSEIVFCFLAPNSVCDAVPRSQRKMQEWYRQTPQLNVPISVTKHFRPTTISAPQQYSRWE